MVPTYTNMITFAEWLNESYNEWVAKGYAHPDDAPIYEKAQQVLDKINSLFFKSSKLVLHPKRRPLAGSAQGLYTHKKLEVSLAVRWKYPKDMGGQWWTKPLPKETIIDTLGHEIAHYYDQTHSGSRFKPTSEYFIDLVKTLWN